MSLLILKLPDGQPLLTSNGLYLVLREAEKRFGGQYFHVSSPSQITTVLSRQTVNSSSILNTEDFND